MKTATVQVDVLNLPEMQRLFSATHQVLVERLLGSVSIHAWNELIEAHDALCPSESDE